MNFRSETTGIEGEIAREEADRERERGNIARRFDVDACRAVVIPVRRFSELFSL